MAWEYWRDALKGIKCRLQRMTRNCWRNMSNTSWRKKVDQYISPNYEQLWLHKQLASGNKNQVAKVEAEDKYDGVDCYVISVTTTNQDSRVEEVKTVITYAFGKKDGILRSMVGMRNGKQVSSFAWSNVAINQRSLTAKNLVLLPKGHQGYNDSVASAGEDPTEIGNAP